MSHFRGLADDSRVISVTKMMVICWGQKFRLGGLWCGGC